MEWTLILCCLAIKYYTLQIILVLITSVSQGKIYLNVRTKLQFLKRDSKVCQEKKQTDIFLNNTKVIAPTVKTQARGQNNLFRALK